MKKKYSVLLFLIVSIMCLHAMYLFSDFGELVEEADLIIIGYVYCGKTAETGAEYGIVIKEILKGNTENM